jgi:diacylglycerol kinase
MRHLLRIVRSFTFATEGLVYLVRTQSNVWVHIVAAVVVLLASLLVGLGGAELAAVVLAIGLVLIAEAFNTALEAAVDLASPSVHPLARTAKDAAAAAVLLAACTAVGVAAAVIAPRLLGLIAR